jgi:hypothetical protein
MCEKTWEYKCDKDYRCVKSWQEKLHVKIIIQLDLKSGPSGFRMVIFRTIFVSGWFVWFSNAYSHSVTGHGSGIWIPIVQWGFKYWNDEDQTRTIWLLEKFVSRNWMPNPNGSIIRIPNQFSNGVEPFSTILFLPFNFWTGNRRAHSLSEFYRSLVYSI